MTQPIPPGFSQVTVHVEADLINPEELHTEDIQLIVRDGNPRQIIVEQTIGNYANAGGFIKRTKGEDEFEVIPFTRIKGNIRVTFPRVSLAARLPQSKLTM